MGTNGYDFAALPIYPRRCSDLKLQMRRERDLIRKEWILLKREREWWNLEPIFPLIVATLDATPEEIVADASPVALGNDFRSRPTPPVARKPRFSSSKSWELSRWCDGASPVPPAGGFPAPQA